MKIIKKDISAIVGLLGSASLAVISGGLINPATTGILSSVGNVGLTLGAGLATNFIWKFSPEKVKRWFVDIHPDNMNHHIKKLFAKSVNEALNNIYVLFCETKISGTEKKEAKQLIKALQKHLPKTLLSGNQIKLEEVEVKHFLYDKDKEDDICHFIKNEFDAFGITEPFKSFLAQNLPTQIQLCFGEGLKDPANQNAWIAFQRMLTEEIRNDIKQIADTQQSIKNDLSDLKFEKSGFSDEQIAEVRQLINLLNNKRLVEVKVKDGITQSLQSIIDKANQIIQITTKTQLTVEELKRIIKRHNTINRIIMFSLMGCLFIVGAFVGYQFVNQPFTATIQVVDWNNRVDNQEIYSKGGIISFDGKKEYDNELTTTNKGKFKLNLPASYKKHSVRVYLQPKEQYQFMKLDTTIVVHKDSTYYLRMYFTGIDKITRTVVNQDGQPIENAIAEINGEEAITDKNGKFTIELPLEKQQRFQKLTIKKDGFIDYNDNNLDMTTNNSGIMWNLKKK